MAKPRKRQVIGWIERDHDFKFYMSHYVGGYRLHLLIHRKNPNPRNITETNHWKKVRVTMEDMK